MKSQLRTFAFSLLLGVSIIACGENQDTDPTPSSDTSAHNVASPSDTAGTNSGFVDPELQLRIERSIYKEYLALIVQIPKKRSDSLVKAASVNPKTMKKTLEEGMATLREKQEEVARTTLSMKYAKPLDSINAIIVRVGEEWQAKQ